MVGLLAILAVGGSAEGEGPAYVLSLDVDAPLILVSGALASSFFELSEHGPPSCAPQCDPSHINFLDRPAAGLYNPRWTTVGDVTTATLLLSAPLVLMLGEGAVNGLSDTLVVGEAALVVSAIQVPVSYAVDRPRPYAYGNRSPLQGRLSADAGRSFFSGHVANAMAVTVATTRVFQKLGRPAAAWTTLVLGVAGSAFLGVTRVASGNHFPTDVLAGAALGTGVGISVPALHAVHVQLAPLPVGGATGLAVSAHFE